MHESMLNRHATESNFLCEYSGGFKQLNAWRKKHIPLSFRFDNKSINLQLQLRLKQLNKHHFVDVAVIIANQFGDNAEARKRLKSHGDIEISTRSAIVKLDLDEKAALIPMLDDVLAQITKRRQARLTRQTVSFSPPPPVPEVVPVVFSNTARPTPISNTHSMNAG